MDADPNLHAGTPTAPPTVPGQLRLEREPIWPRALGVIGVVLGVLGVLGGAWGVYASTILIGGMSGSPGAAAWEERWRSWTVLSSIVSMALAALLVAGAVLLLLQRRRARAALLGWSVLRLAWVVASVAISLPMFQQQMAAAAHDASPPPPGVTSLIIYFSIGVQVVWGSALPAFCLAWFSRPAIREQVRAWR